MLLVVDANILVSVVLGRSLSLLADIASRDVVLLVPLRMMLETGRILSDPARLGSEVGLSRLSLLQEFVTILEQPRYEQREDQARARLFPAAQNDWPVLAAALAFEAAIWSNDRHFFGTGVAVWSTRNVSFLDAQA